MQFTYRLAMIAAAGLLSAGAVACDSQRDPEARVTRALEDAKIDDVNVDWDNDEKVMRLKGTVGSNSERTEAESIAHRSVGTSGQIANELSVEGEPREIPDNIDDPIRERLEDLTDRDPMLDGRDIYFDVNNGVVTITGTVRSAAEKQRVVEIADKTAGIRQVINWLRISKDRARSG